VPLTEKGSEIKEKMESEYGSKKGEEVFYASRNAGTITGVDEHSLDASGSGGDAIPIKITPAEINKKNREFWRET
jgi:hypothetical protein